MSDTKEKKKEKLKAGEYGYIDDHKKRQLFKIILWVIAILAVVLGGWLYFGTRINLVTLIGIFLVLPAAKAVVNYAVIMRYHTGDREKYEKIKGMLNDHFMVLSDLVITRYEGSMGLEIVVIHGGNLFAYVPEQKTSVKEIRDYLAESVQYAGSEAIPSVFTDFGKFEAFIKKVSDSKTEIGKKDQLILKDLMSKAV